MRKIHWSEEYADFISIEVDYNDGCRQGWGYDCQQYLSLDALKQNMAADFKEQRDVWESLTVFVLKDGVNFTAELDVTELTSEEFVQYVFEAIEGFMNGD